MLQNADKTVIRRFSGFLFTKTALRHFSRRKPKMVRHRAGAPLSALVSSVGRGAGRFL